MAVTRKSKKASQDELVKALDELAAAVQDLLAQLEDAKIEASEADARTEEFRERADSARQALRTYGKHIPGCPISGKCTCGWDGVSGDLW